MGDNKDKNMNLLDRYIDEQDPICREERQYALFLYNYLCSMKKGEDAGHEEIRKQLFGTESVEIEEVYYEATFMRDLFFWDKKQKEWEQRFNQYLLEYVKEIPEISRLQFREWSCSNEERKPLKELQEETYVMHHLGMYVGLPNGEEKVNFGKKINTMLKALMNSTPDIAIVYVDGSDVRHLAFLECKYESPEGHSGEKGMRIFQTEAQNAIAYFLTNMLPDYVADVYDDTRIVKFYKSEPRRKSEEKVYLSVSDLVRYHNSLMNKKVPKSE